ncbi:hypothetical protein C943_00576 [Mariniradius saccharolyticus AK6]|uniref:Uncharacterized protein n=1 Tax=Mariniradius saccharolyticus AK6 TaxID=1239962 RepID=M7XFI9_9BACT|nr:hypothetical protein C943_00576 [Mariniradius saccharolyticus AK6]
MAFAIFLIKVQPLTSGFFIISGEKDENPKQKEVRTGEIPCSKQNLACVASIVTRIIGFCIESGYLFF